MTQLASYFEPLIVASVGLASKLHDHQQQMNILDQTKTLSESSLQMLYAAKEGGGNPKVPDSSYSHSVFSLPWSLSQVWPLLVSYIQQVKPRIKPFVTAEQEEYSPASASVILYYMLFFRL